jgi:two-component system alkaline phosphatase synthesis response regulator PhoP
MKKKIAIVEDDDLIRAMIQLNLEKNGYSSSAFPSAEEAQQFSDSEFYDLIICDVLLPGISGFEFLKRLREKGDNTPVLMLTVKSDVSSRLQAFNIGTDDYLVKPFNMHELTARVKALIRRSQGERRIPAEINLLIYLIENSHHELSRADILEEVWGMDVAPTPRTIDNFILKFRRLFEDNPDKPRHFISIRGKGYTYEP